MIKKVSKNTLRQKRHARIRSKVNGTASVPRLNVYRSNTNIYAQLIDDVNGVTIVSANTADKDFKGTSKSDVLAAEAIGEMIAERAKAKNINKVVFDRSGYKYHGRIKALADKAREAGLEF